ncbi:MAG: HAD hydrolase family protein [Bacteroidetes bacterium]|nr:HAD hydrolase family protein [Bacteroidota bacterium]
MPSDHELKQQHYLSLFKQATAIVMDVDGVLTDGSLVITEEGNQLRTMNIRDGFAIRRAVDNGMKLAVVSGGRSQGVLSRLSALGIENVRISVEEKVNVLKRLTDELNLDLATTIYIGDDIPDLEVMKLCGIPCCPADAASEVMAISKYISPLKGGSGCVRDILEKVLKLQGKWN